VSNCDSGLPLESGVDLDAKVVVFSSASERDIPDNSRVLPLVRTALLRGRVALFAGEQGFVVYGGLVVPVEDIEVTTPGTGVMELVFLISVDGSGGVACVLEETKLLVATSASATAFAASKSLPETSPNLFWLKSTRACCNVLLAAFNCPIVVLVIPSNRLSPVPVACVFMGRIVLEPFTKRNLSADPDNVAEMLSTFLLIDSKISASLTTHWLFGSLLASSKT